MLQANNLVNIVKVIITHQAMIIGPIAFEQASKVKGLVVSKQNNLDIEVKEGDPDSILTNLVRKYEELFGKASIEVCKQAIKEIRPPIQIDDLPDILR
jgi:hypothetical protein